MDTEHIHKRHNVNLLIYHIVCPAKYRRKVFTEGVSETLKQVCHEHRQNHQKHHCQRSIQTTPRSENISAGRGNLWTMGYYVNTVGQYGNLQMISSYVKNQGIKNYEQLHHQQPTLFTTLS